MKLPDETLVYPAHDYKGDTVSTVAEERAHNPRLQVRSVDDYVAVMNALKLPNPKMMDVAVPANMRVGLSQERIAAKGWALSATEAIAAQPTGTIMLIDLREDSERDRHGRVDAALNAPYTALADALAPGGVLHALAGATGRRLVFFCAYGERSAMAVEAAHVAGFADACHVQGGLDAWIKAGGPLLR